MIRVYICPKCGWIRTVSRRKDVECFKCGEPQMTLTKLDYVKYVNMEQKERDDYADGWMYINNRDYCKNKNHKAH